MLMLLLQLADSHHGLLLLLHALLCELIHQRLLVRRLLGWLDRGGHLRWRGCLLLLLLCATTTTVAINCVEVLLVLLLLLLELLLLLRLALSSSLLHVKVVLVLCCGCCRSRL